MRPAPSVPMQVGLQNGEVRDMPAGMPHSGVEGCGRAASRQRRGRQQRRRLLRRRPPVATDHREQLLSLRLPSGDSDQDVDPAVAEQIGAARALSIAA